MKTSEIHIPLNANTETLIAAIDMIIEAQDNGYSVMIINDDETRAFAYKNANDCRVTVDILGMSVDLVALRRKALKREITPIKGSFNELFFSKLTRKQAENAIAEAEDAFFNENHWKRGG